MLDEKHRDTLRLDLAKERVEAFRLGRIHAGGGLVEQQKLRPAGERAGDFEPALIAVGERAGGPAGGRAKADEGEQFARPRRRRRAPSPGTARAASEPR